MKNAKTNSKSDLKLVKTIIFFAVLVSVVLLLFRIFGTSPLQIYKEVTLQRFYNELTNNDCEWNYNARSDNYKASNSSFKWISDCESVEKPISENFEVYSYKVEGNIGYVDRKVLRCWSTECAGREREEERAVKKYLFVNGKWILPDELNSIYCTRKEPYDNPPEFERAISLISQRFRQSNLEDNINFANDIDEASNCIKMKYAGQSEIGDSEGLFKLSEDSTNDNLEILVSPEYQYSDDLLTSILIMHELTHALQFTRGYLTYDNCFESEAYAFTNEYVLTLNMNNEEIESLNSRYNRSEKVRQAIDNINMIKNYQGNDYYEKALNYVQSNPYYQQQCAQ